MISSKALLALLVASSVCRCLDDARKSLLPKPFL